MHSPAPCAHCCSLSRLLPSPQQQPMPLCACTFLVFFFLSLTQLVSALASNTAQVPSSSFSVRKAIPEMFSRCIGCVRCVLGEPSARRLNLLSLGAHAALQNKLATWWHRHHQLVLFSTTSYFYEKWSYPVWMNCLFTTKFFSIFVCYKWHSMSRLVCLYVRGEHCSGSHCKPSWGRTINDTVMATNGNHCAMCSSFCPLYL